MSLKKVCSKCLCFQVVFKKLGWKLERLAPSITWKPVLFHFFKVCLGKHKSKKILDTLFEISLTSNCKPKFKLIRQCLVVQEFFEISNFLNKMADFCKTSSLGISKIMLSESIKLRKICQIKGFSLTYIFLFEARIHDFVLKLENTGQRKPLFWQGLHNVTFNACLYLAWVEE